MDLFIRNWRNRDDNKMFTNCILKGEHIKTTKCRINSILKYASIQHPTAEKASSIKQVGSGTYDFGVKFTK